MLRVDNLEILEDILYAFHPCLLYLCNVKVGITQSGNLLKMSSLVGLVFLLEAIENVAYTQAIA